MSQKQKQRLREVTSKPKVIKLSLAGSHLKLNTGLGIRELETAVHTGGSRGCHWAPAGLGLQRASANELTMMPCGSLLSSAL